MENDKFFLCLFFALFLFFCPGLSALSQTEPTPTPSGRPADAFAATTAQKVSCTCTNTAGTCTWNCEFYSPPEMRPCIEVCKEQADMYCK